MIPCPNPLVFNVSNPIILGKSSLGKSLGSNKPHFPQRGASLLPLLEFLARGEKASAFSICPVLINEQTME